VLAVAQQMAQSVGDQLGDVLRRDKSKSWLFGAVRKRAGGRHGDSEIHDAIAALARQHKPAISDELGARAVSLSSRRQSVFHEPSDFPAWGPRVEQLAGLLNGEPVEVPALFELTRTRLGWENPNWTKNVLAAAENAGALHYHRRSSRWARQPELDEQDMAVLPPRAATGQQEVAFRSCGAPPAIAVQVRGRPRPRPRRPPRRANHPWRTKLMTTASPTPEKTNGKQNGAGATSTPPAASAEKGAGAERADSKPHKRPGPKPGTPRPKARAKPPSFEDELERALTPSLERVVRNVLGRTLGKLVAEAVGGAK
jgi:hypothetical protein